MVPLFLIRLSSAAVQVMSVADACRTYLLRRTSRTHEMPRQNRTHVMQAQSRVHYMKCRSASC